MSALEDLLAFQLRAARLPPPQREVGFVNGRRWRFDFAWPQRRLAVEVEGGTASGKSRHSRGKGFERDCEKYNTAALHDWRVLRMTAAMVRDGRALQWVERALTDG